MFFHSAARDVYYISKPVILILVGRQRHLLHVISHQISHGTRSHPDTKTYIGRLANFNRIAEFFDDKFNESVFTTELFEYDVFLRVSSKTKVNVFAVVEERIIGFDVLKSFFDVFSLANSL